MDTNVQTFNPKYALENLLRTQITSKQGISLIYKTSP